jgi:hypothetical protein
MPPTIRQQIDKYKKHCTWRGSDLNARKPPLAAWKLATRPKREGGLGIINLKTQNEALLMKHLHKFINRIDCPWVNLVWNNYYYNGSLPDHRPKGSFRWRSLLKLLTKFKGTAISQMNQGSSVLMWQDMWNNGVRSLHMPELFSFTLNPYISVK